ncbi:hypothetical protein EUX98_g3171 [Antrodiella citrinella]|uniref:Uncharacterized protein n=1 Tax=Antrodiella citrinella TaxID=2447956 RepID=A0A4S4MX86_9APHY|nr:hypothetical protein EUX98_g3171 [Antrodiella citrinella]
MFDVRAAGRRFGPRACYSSNLAVQFKKYCTTLKHIRQANLDADSLTLDLWNAFFMMIENDGRNAAQLEWAGLRTFVDKLVRERLWHNRGASHGWPAENTVNALALWLMWFTTDQDTINTEMTTPEGQQRRLQLLDLVRPYVVTAVRYPSFHAPDNHFDFPLSPALRREFPYSLITPHGFYPLYRQPDFIVERHTHYNMQLDVAPPPITIAAKLLYFSRSEAQEVQYSPLIPVDRDAANIIHQERWPNERPYPSPTQADWREFNAHKAAKLVDQGSWDWRTKMSPEEGALEDDGVWRKGLKAASTRWDNDWQRFTCCWDPWVMCPLKGVVYTYGSMHGLWSGRMLIPDITNYFALVTSATFPTNFSVENPSMIMQPIYFYLREHHCINPELPLSTGGTHDGFDEGIVNGWFPSFKSSEHGGVVRITDTERGEVSRYETYVPGKPNSHSEDRCTECLAKRAYDQAEMRARKAEREKMDAEAQRRVERERVRAGKRKREGVESEGDAEGDERSRRRLTPPNPERKEPEQLEDSDALDYIPDDFHPRPRRVSKANEDDESEDADDDDDEGAEDSDEEADAVPHGDPVPPSPTPSGSTQRRSESQEPLPADEEERPPPHREATLEEIRITVDEALGPEHNVDDILDQAMAEGNEGEDGEEEYEDGEFETQEITPSISYDNGPEKFADEREDIEGSTSSDADDEYTEYIENTCNGIQDIIITGETLPRHGQAFHHFRFYGRVRRWDGLVAVVRVPTTEPRLGVSIFRGYLTANRNWVGCWRAFTSNVRSIPHEGPFIASRVDES